VIERSDVLRRQLAPQFLYAGGRPHRLWGNRGCAFRITPEKLDLHYQVNFAIISTGRSVLRFSVSAVIRWLDRSRL